MKLSRLTKILLIFVLLFSFFISIGYSALNASVSVSGDLVYRVPADIRITGVKISSVTNGGLEQYSPKYTKDTVSVGLKLPNLNSTVVYEVTIKNSSSKKKKIATIANKVEGNTNISYTYDDALKTTIAPNSTATLLLTYKYNSDITSLPIEQIKENTISLTFSGLKLYNVLKQDANTNNHAKLYTGDTSTFNGKENVYYYYGETPNNNVLFGGFCWRMVRTTDTGGVKMIYNGEPDSEGKCGSTRGQHVGYGSRSNQSLSSSYMYGTDYTYDETSKTFTLAGTTETATWSDTTSTNLIGKYTCKNETGSCSSLYLVESYSSNTSAYTLPINSTTKYSQIGISAFNTNYTSPADVGYMYNKRYIYSSKDLSTEGKIDAETVGIEETDYDVKSNTVVTDEEANIYSFDSNTKKWTSNNHKDGSTSTIELGVKEEGTYYFNYVVSSEKKYDKVTLYLDGTKKGEYSGTTSGKIRLGNLTLTSVIKVEYTKDSIGSSGTDNVIFSIEKSTGVEVDDRWLYGNSFTYDGENYTLADTEKAVLSQDSLKLTSKHYTCWNTSGTCKKVSYVYYSSETTAYYIDLENGTNVEKALDEMLYDENVNTKDSAIKNVIDLWYSKNMTKYTDYFEDTVWCNDRSMDNQSNNGWNPNGGNMGNYLYFKSYGNSSSLTCTNKNDRFTVDSKNGNGALKYPVGLVTRQEQGLAYSGSSPLSDDNSHWTLSPSYFSDYFAYGYIVYSRGSIGGNISTHYVGSRAGVRPAVSLRAGIEYLEGDGTADTPYIVDMDS